MRRRLSGWLLVIGLVGLVLFEVLMFEGVEPFASWFYPLAWWPYIVIADCLVYRLKGDSLLLSRPREFLVMLPWSVFCWLLFEAFNLKLENWYYLNVIEAAWARWPGYFFAYATVLPGLFETTELLEALGLYRNWRVRPIPETRAWYPYFVAVGLGFIALPLIWPRYFFPLVWCAFFFLLEPANHALGGRSLMREWQQGNLRKVGLLLTAGLICGLLWEFWNFWARTKWVYSVPYFTEFKLFEMPLAGFLGFPPFAVGCYVMYNSLSVLRGGRGWEQGMDGRGLSRAGIFTLGLIWAATYALVCWAIDNYTVRSWISWW